MRPLQTTSPTTLGACHGEALKTSYLAHRGQSRGGQLTTTLASSAAAVKQHRTFLHLKKIQMQELCTLCTQPRFNQDLSHRQRQRKRKQTSLTKHSSASASITTAPNATPTLSGPLVNSSCTRDWDMCPIPNHALCTSRLHAYSPMINASTQSAELPRNAISIKSSSGKSIKNAVYTKEELVYRNNEKDSTSGLQGSYIYNVRSTKKRPALRDEPESPWRQSLL